ncbi:MAG: hypothetical protein H6502_04015 [Candidatus Woesearchaeota archaeon]|nr:MAG: hypothetical protein H6502_04015 [Candidatus Woesearchaeota archaeon]
MPQKRKERVEFQIGKQGLTKSVLDEALLLFKRHKKLKIKLNQNLVLTIGRSGKQELFDELVLHLQPKKKSTIGSVLYVEK